MMRILVVSDSHKLNVGIQKIVMNEGPFDRVIHLGDSCVFESEVREIVKCPVDIIAGNCDTMSYFPKEKVIEIGKHKILLVHGHNHGVKYGYERLIHYGLEKEVDTVMFGHIHTPVMMEMPGMTLVNPGSISLPRQASRKPTYIIMEVDEDGEVKYIFKEL